MNINQKLITKKYKVVGNVLSKKYTAITLADLHLVNSINQNMLKNINQYLKQTRDNIDFILMPGDLSSYKYYLDDKKFDYLKRTVLVFQQMHHYMRV